MGSRKMIACLLVLVIAASIHSATAQSTRHVVGGNTGWTVGTGVSTYTTWAASQTFRVGDTLVFNFATGRHDVATVTKAAFDACNASTTIVPLMTSSPATITLNSAGEHYYFCTFPGHCLAGQKLAINVTGSSTASPPTTTTPTPTPTPTPTQTTPSTTATTPTSSTTPPPTAGGPPPPNSAATHTFASFSTIFFSAAALLL